MTRVSLEPSQMGGGVLRSLGAGEIPGLCWLASCHIAVNRFSEGARRAFV